jgi:ubiquinone/menaquinone biosynthesis C-methylase UbiE
MKIKTYYGYPLSSILLRLIVNIMLLLLLFALFFLDIPLELAVIITIISIPLSLYMSTIRFNHRFMTYRSQILSEMISLAHLKGNEQILDLGTGSGYLAIGYAHKLPEGYVHGVDKYQLKYDSLREHITCMIKINFFGNSLTHAQRNAHIDHMEKRCTFIPYDLTKPLNFPDETFDLIVSSQFLYCVPIRKHQSTYQEIDRLLKPSGMLLFFESPSFLRWNIHEVQTFFERKGYVVRIIDQGRLKAGCILQGTKPA